MDIIEQAINSFSSLPGIGPKMARRIIYYILNGKQEIANELANNLCNLTSNIHKCKECGKWTSNDTCEICSSNNTNKSLLCIVEQSFDADIINSSGSYNGLFHILGGAISPMNGIMPNNLNLAGLKDRIIKNNIKEIIFATNPTDEGEATAEYVKGLLKDIPSITFTRLSSGIQAGGDLEYAAIRAINESFNNRHKF